MSGDIAVVRLLQPVQRGRASIRLPSPGLQLSENCSLTLLGWGSMQLGGPLSSSKIPNPHIVMCFFPMRSAPIIVIQGRKMTVA